MKIVEDEHYTFCEYKQNVDKKRLECPLEKVGFQPLISSLLERILINTGIQVIAVSDNRKNGTQNHDPSGYMGDRGAPDLLFARNFTYYNKNKSQSSNVCDVEQIAVVEIKVPYKQYNIEQIKSHLTKVKKVIFTNLVKWVFFEDNENPTKTIDLQIGRIYKSTWSRNPAEHPIIWKSSIETPDDFLLNELGLPLNNIEAEPVEWEELLTFIKEFVFEKQL